MKILIISPHPRFGGGSTANQNIAAMLTRQGHDVVYADEFLKADSSLEFQLTDIPVYKCRMFKKRVITRYIKVNKFDMVICGVPQMMAFYFLNFAFLRLFSKVKIGIIFHSLCIANNIKGKIFERLIAFSTLFTDHLFYVSGYTKRIWRKYLPLRWTSAKHHIIHNAVPDANVRNVLAADRPRISLVGRLSPEKRPHIFCNLAEELSEKYEFVVWGDGPMSDELMAKYSSKVKFMGYESNPDKIYSNTDILMVTSEFENCPMVILEARTYGVPTLTVNVGGISEILQDGVNGLFFDESLTPAEVDLKITDIIGNYTKYQDGCHQTKVTLDLASKTWDDAVSDR